VVFVGYLSFLRFLSCAFFLFVVRILTCKPPYRSLQILAVIVAALSSSHRWNNEAERKMPGNELRFSRPIQPFSIAIYKINRHSLFTPSPSPFSTPVEPSFATPCSDKTDPSSASAAPFEP
jgi:hypothetical protein